LGKLVFVGLGLNSEKSISLLGLEEAKSADTVFAEFYTSLMPELSIAELEKLTGKCINTVTRQDLEEDSGNKILAAARKGKVVFMVPGDPLVATTHVDLRIRAERQGITTKIVHGPSIVSAVIGLSGLQNYKFGRSVTIPFSNSRSMISTPYDVISANKKLDLHTLCFLDIREEEKKYMTVREALDLLLSIEADKRQQIVTQETWAIGVARAGSEEPTIKADLVGRLQSFDFGKPPHSLIFPSRLHFVEAEALITLGKATEAIRELMR
jgi:diphthine synthase